MRSRKTLAELRSRRWFGVDDLRAFGHRSRARQMGYDKVDWDRPVVGIINTWSDINQCHAHFPDRVQWVKRGILQAGGMPLELPALSLSEPFVKPTTMLYRNLLAMECEELIRSHPIDGVVLNYVNGDLRDKIDSVVKLGDPLLVVGMKNDLRVEVTVPEREIQMVREGKSGKIATTAMPSATTKIIVDQIVPLGNPKEGSNTFKVYARIDDEISPRDGIK